MSDTETETDVSDIEDEKKKLIKKKPKRIIKKVWHTQQESILKRWSEIGSSYRFMHDRSFTKFEKQNLRFALPVIIISTVTGTANFAQGSFPKSWQVYVPLLIGFLNLSAGLLTTVAQFLRVSELLEGHRAAAIAYSKFSRNISVELSLPRQERSLGGTEFINNCRAELDRLIEQTPNIPLAIIKQFGRKFKNDAFFKPDILKISEVEVFKDVKGEAMKEKLRELKHAEEIKRELINTEHFRRKTLLIENKTKKDIENLNIMRKKVEKKQKKKDNLDLSSVQNRMDKLLAKLQNADAAGDVLTPSSSDQEDFPQTHTEAINSKIELVIMGGANNKIIASDPSSNKIKVK
jgi:hypothetical protein